VDDALVAEVDEVLHGQPSAERLVDEHAVDVVVAHHAPDDHQRQRSGRDGQLRGRHARADEDDAVGAVLEEHLERRALAAALQAAGQQQDSVTERRGELLDRRGDLREERVVQVVEHHADRLRAAAGEAAGHRVGAVAQPRRRGEHALAALGRDLRAVAHDQRDERA
jgi:hypothetical protein